MKRFVVSAAWIASVALAQTVPQKAPQTNAAASHKTVIAKYCVTCHSQKLRTGGLLLEGVDLVKAGDNAELFEKVIKKVRTASMPPLGMPRPDEATLDELASYLESSLDRLAAAKPNPGRATLHRLNRTEYANAVKEMFALELDPASLLPADDESYGFDNMADVLKVSPSLMERYLSASWRVSRFAVGDPAIVAETLDYRVKPDLTQDYRLDGMPLGTRGGVKVQHYFPLDGEYVIKVRLWRATSEIIRGLDFQHQIEISVDGQRVKLVSVGGKDDQIASEKNSGASAADVDNRLTIRVPVKAGPRTVMATFLTKSAAQDDDILQPFIRTTLDVVGYQGMPVVDRLTVSGPYKGSAPTDTPSRRKIFVCRPATAAEELPCVKKILTGLTRKAYRRPANDADLEGMLGFYQRARNEGGNFDAGIEAALQLLLSSPEFLFRFEADPANLSADAVYRVNDLQLASRLSFFLWSAGPDETLVNLAVQGRLKDPAVLEAQVKRMLADSRSRALVDNFAGQWLYLRNLRNTNPDFETFPDFDDNLRVSMRQETELFFENILREDRNVMEFLTADYSFVNERMARHYGIPGIYGPEFRKVQIKDPYRRGLLGQASILTLTSYATRTSPVQRGKWILTNLLGTPPPPPPPNVPALSTNAAGAKPRSLRERMEEHRSNAFCAGCHRVIDPVGFSLENFDALGQWRDTDEGARIDPSGTLFNGAKVAGPTELREMLTKRPDNFVKVMTEKLLTYAIGRGPEYYDMPAVRAIVRDAAKNDYKFSSIIMGVVKSTPFQYKVKKAAEADTKIASR